jgi:SAM-dependent MidA family methyltransferase
MRVEWQRDETSPPAGAADEGNAALVDSLREEIARGGPITFARFMERALYDPGNGYYTTAVTRPTRAGDFLTAPELHPIFGRTLTTQVEEMWHLLGEPADFMVREYGAGSGALFLSILDGLDRMASPLAQAVRYDPVDFALQRSLIRDRLSEIGREGQLLHIADDHKSLVGVVIANEFVDALPVHRVMKLNGMLREIHVDWRDERFTEIAGPLTDERLVAWFTDAGIELADNQRAEVNLGMLDWLATTSAAIDKGYLVVIDYGAGAADLYGQDRPTGTIRAFSDHHVSADVLSGVGERDITSHVDFDALERSARAFGFEVAGRRRSNEFLLACGLDDTYSQARAETDQDWDAALNLRSAIQRLLDPNALGGYLVSVLAKNAPTAELLGFAQLKPRT